MLDEEDHPYTREEASMTTNTTKGLSLPPEMVAEFHRLRAEQQDCLKLAGLQDHRRKPASRAGYLLRKLLSSATTQVVDDTAQGREEVQDRLAAVNEALERWCEDLAPLVRERTGGEVAVGAHAAYDLVQDRHSAWGNWAKTPNEGIRRSKSAIRLVQRSSQEHLLPSWEKLYVVDQVGNWSPLRLNLKNPGWETTAPILMDAM